MSWLPSVSEIMDLPMHMGCGPQMHTFDGFCLLNHFTQIGICYSRSNTLRKIAIEGPKHHFLALVSLSVTTDLPAHFWQFLLTQPVLETDRYLPFQVRNQSENFFRWPEALCPGSHQTLCNNGYTRAFGVRTPNAHFFYGFCLLNHFYREIGIRHSRSGTNRKIAIEGPKHRVLALISVSVITDLPAHLGYAGSRPQMRAFDNFSWFLILSFGRNSKKFRFEIHFYGGACDRIVKNRWTVPLNITIGP